MGTGQHHFRYAYVCDLTALHVGEATRYSLGGSTKLVVARCVSLLLISGDCASTTRQRLNVTPARAVTIWGKFRVYASFL